MSVSNPAQFPRDYDGFYDPNFTADINNKMRVPRRIRVAGNADDQDQSEYFPRPVEQPKFNMMVPDRILVAGQDHHIGLKSTPRELHLEQSLMPKLTESVSLNTPPQVLTLDEHHFPTVEDEENEQEGTNSSKCQPSLESELHTSNCSTINTIDQSLTLSYPATPPLPTEVASPSEELLQLRRHMARLGRRVMILEHESQQRQQRDTVMCSLSVAYFILKTLMWLHRHW